MYRENFIRAIQEKRKIKISFYSKEDDTTISRVCAPMDFGPSRRAKNQDDRYHMWDYDSENGPHTLSLQIHQVENIEVLDEYFDPGEFVTWLPNWIISRDWGIYS